MEKKLTPREFINHRFPQFKNIKDKDLTNIIDGNTMLSLMEDYYTYRNILSKTSNGADHYDYYH